ncbi:retrovirus-related pol polyprotein from transposon TNT 1-94 [Tanacetum coccineum]
MSKRFEVPSDIMRLIFELDLQKCKEKIKMTNFQIKSVKRISEERGYNILKSKDLKAQLQDKGIAISELKKLIEKMKGKSVETKFEKSSVIRQPNAFKSQRQSILVTAQILPQNVLPIFKNTNVIAPGMYKVHTKPNQTRTQRLPQDIRKTNKRVSFSTGVIPTTSVSRPQLKSNQLEDRVMPNNSQGKKQNVEDHRRNFKFSNNKTSVTACNDSLNAKTSNVNFVCVTCGKCVLNDNHDLCVLHYINGVNSRTRQPMAYALLLVEILLFIFDSGCSKHMTGNLKLLTNFVEKFLGTVKFGNDQIAPILGYGDLKSTCYIRDLKGNDLLTGSHGTYLYSITLQDSTTPNPICLMAKATSSQAWLWHRRLSHLKIDTINLLSKNNIVNGLPKLKFVKDHLYNFYTCTYVRLESINGKKYVLIIIDDYSRYTWTHFLRSKYKTPGVLIDFLTLVQRGLHAQVTTVRINKGTEFLNKTLHAYFAKEGIRHDTSTARTPEQNSVVERQNHTLVEAARTMLSATKVSLFFWAEAIATACFTQNRSLVIPRHEKTPYHIINAQKPSVKFFHIFGSLCYIVRDGENLDKIKEKGDACIFVGYSTQLKAYRVFNKKTRIIVETIHVNFDELPQMALDHISSDPVETVTTLNELELLYSLMFSEILNGTSPVMSKSSAVHAVDNPDKRQQHNTTHTSTTTDVAKPPPFNINSTHQTPTQGPTVTTPENINQAETNTKNAQFDDDEFINIFSTPVQE